MSLRKKIAKMQAERIMGDDWPGLADEVINTILDAATEKGKKAQIEHQKKNGVFSDSGGAVINAIQVLKENKE